jgi:hypothetical protein
MSNSKNRRILSKSNRKKRNNRGNNFGATSSRIKEFDGKSRGRNR